MATRKPYTPLTPTAAINKICEEAELQLPNLGKKHTRAITKAISFLKAKTLTGNQRKYTNLLRQVKKTMGSRSAPAVLLCVIFLGQEGACSLGSKNAKRFAQQLSIALGNKLCVDERLEELVKEHPIFPPTATPPTATPPAATQPAAPPPAPMSEAIIMKKLMRKFFIAVFPSKYIVQWIRQAGDYVRFEWQDSGPRSCFYSDHIGSENGFRLLLTEDAARDLQLVTSKQPH